MLWVFIGICLVPLIFLPKITYNVYGVPQTLALGMLSSLGVIAGVGSGHLPHSHPALIACLFLFYIFLSSLWTIPHHNARKELGLQIPLILVFLLGSIYLDSSLIKWSCIAITFLVGFNVVYSHAQTLEIDPFFPNAIKAGGPKDNPIGSCGNPNFLAGFFSGTLWLTVYAGFVFSSFLLVITLLGLLMLARTKSRAGQLGIFGSAIFFILVLAYYGQLPDHIGKLELDNDLIFNLGLGLVLFGFVIILSLFKINWEKFFNSEIDPRGPQVWFASFRYRVCYWLAAFELIKQKPLFGWGLWSYRREVYNAQATINDRNPKFLSDRRYLTPQPRECHNDFIEHLVEYGLVGFTIFMVFVGYIYWLGFGHLEETVGTKDFFLMIFLLCNLTSLMIDAFFFFPLRASCVAIYFWLTCGMIVALTNKDVFIFQPSLLLTITISLFLLVFLWHCIGRRTLASYNFMRSEAEKTPQGKALRLIKAINYSPNDSILRTFAAISCLGVEPVLAGIHSTKIIEHYDGMVPLHGALFNLAAARAQVVNKFDEAILLLKNAHWALPSFKPALEMLSARGIANKAMYRGGRATMREVDQGIFWKVRAMIEATEKTVIEEQLVIKQLENVKLRKDLAHTSMQNALLEERKRLNIPNNWVYDADKGVFLNPDEMTDEQRKTMQAGVIVVNPADSLG